jgi:diguanylate cyclase (GGDEF)-like protein
VIGFGAMGLSMFMRGVHMLFHNNPVDDANSLVMGVTMLVIPLGQICISTGLILMVMWRHAERLRQLSTLDPLTGALNRAGLEVQGTRVGQRSLRSGRSVAVVMIDVDHFKLINDTYGHPVGDEVLRHLTRLLKAELRPADVLARYGGEEFVLVLDGLDLQSATRVADRLRGRIEAALVGVDHVTVRYTASVGVVTSNEHGYELRQLIAAGDAAMYEAKRAGRNQVVCG